MMTKPKYTTEEYQEFSVTPFRELSPGHRVAVRVWKARMVDDAAWAEEANRLINEHQELTLEQAYERTMVRPNNVEQTVESEPAGGDADSESPVVDEVMFEFVDEVPADLGAIPTGSSAWRMVAGMLEQNPGQWARVKVCSNRKKAIDLASRIRHGSLKAFRPGVFDARFSENPKGVHGVYARYTGESAGELA